MKEQVFISYSWVDAPVVKSITEQLRSDGYVPWVDREHLDLNGDLCKQIKEGICSSDYFVLIYSSESVLQKSTWVEFEIETAKNYLAEERILRLDIDKKKVIFTGVASNKAFAHSLHNAFALTFDKTSSQKNQSSLVSTSYKSHKEFQMSQNVITETNLTNVALANRGKVRDLYDLGDELLIISTDRISAFDVVLPNGIPYKGQILTGLSEFWFDYTKSIVDNHIISTDVSQYPDVLQADAEVLEGRSMFVRKANRIDIECVVRGYIAGSAWSEYKEAGTVCGEKMPAGLTESERLPELIFTPSTKAEQGEHDENISIAEMVEVIGQDLSDKIIQTSFALFEAASEHAEKSGIILCDTKFEFGQIDGQLILIDEVFTPDSSRFWPKDEYKPGGSPPSFDKQYVRDYLSDVGWNKEPPAPELPADVINQTSEKYLEAYRLIVGRELL